MKYNKTQSKWCINKYGASKIIDTFEMYQASPNLTPARPRVVSDNKRIIFEMTCTITILIIYVSIEC
jgi:hypothetical protein